MSSEIQSTEQEYVLVYSHYVLVYCPLSFLWCVLTVSQNIS